MNVTLILILHFCVYFASVGVSMHCVINKNKRRKEDTRNPYLVQSMDLTLCGPARRSGITTCRRLTFRVLYKKKDTSTALKNN